MIANLYVRKISCYRTANASGNTSQSTSATRRLKLTFLTTYFPPEKKLSAIGKCWGIMVTIHRTTDAIYTTMQCLQKRTSLRLLATHANFEVCRPSRSEDMADFRSQRSIEPDDPELCIWRGEGRRRKGRRGVRASEMEPGLRVTGQRVTGSAIWVRVGSGHGSKP